MSELGAVLQEALRRERGARTIVGFLRAKMERLEGERRRRNLKERLGFAGMGCCGATWSRRTPAISVREEEEEEDDEEDEELQHATITNTDQTADPCSTRTPAPSAMNLAAALAAERRLRSSPEEMEAEGEGEGEAGWGWTSGGGTGERASLMRLVEESEGGEKEEKRGEGRGRDRDWACCVCMGRKKGAAFIPCGHTFCRVCSREMWLNRGLCPLCNRSILEILDIF